MTEFAPRDRSDVKRLLDCYPLCWVVSGGREDRQATPLPLLAECDAEGRVASLLGHIAMSNPQQKALQSDPRATILCMGPQGYISPRLVSNPTWGPTWNYAVCRFETKIDSVPEENDAALYRLAAALEGEEAESWTPQRMGDRYEQLKPRIIAFRASVIETHARFKLGQDENRVTFDEIINRIPDGPLGQWMSRTRE